VYWGIASPKAYKSNFFHHDFVQFRKTLDCQLKLDCQILLKSPGLSMGMGFLWESHGKRSMGWDRHKLLWDGNGTYKYVPWTAQEIAPAKLTDWIRP